LNGLERLTKGTTQLNAQKKQKKTKKTGSVVDPFFLYIQ
jgi:hypothetical protein